MKPERTKKITDRIVSPSIRSTLFAWLVLAIGVPVSFFLFVLIQNSVENIARLRFEREAKDANSIVESRIRAYGDVLYAVRALFSSEGPIDRLRFHRFIQSLDIKRRYPGFISLNYAAYVTARERKHFEETVRRDTSLDPRGYPRFSIRPPGERPEYYVIVYLEPMEGYEFGFGLDMGATLLATNPEKVAAAVRLHRDSGRLIASGQPLRVKRARETIYLAMRLAAYGKGMPIDTVEQRRAAYIGSIGSGFDIESLIKEALNEETLQHMRIRLFDVGSAIDSPDAEPTVGKTLLFDSDQKAGKYPPHPGANASESTFVYALPIEVASRNWVFEYRARKNTIINDTDRLLPLLILAGGLLLSVLLFGVLYSLASSRSRAVEIANEITRDLRSSTEQLQAVSRRLVDAQESERRQFSRELHDRVGQNLTALSINLDILKTQVSEKGGDALLTRLDDASTLLESTAGAIENVMSELRPPMLDDYGLLPALQWYANDFSDRTGIEVKVHGDEHMERLPQASEIGLFRIAQEALNNVAKHAHAEHVDISLEHSGDEFTMSVADDGRGLDSAAANAPRRRAGLGMMTMRERTQAIDGRFEVAGAPGGGTQVVVRIPC
jgi:signal transduction histidine kinase